MSRLELICYLRSSQGGLKITRLFIQEPNYFIRFFVSIILSISLMIMDTHYKGSTYRYRVFGDNINLSIHRLIYLPKLYTKRALNTFSSIDKLQEENSRLRRENLRYQGELYKLGALEIENEQLRQLLNAAPKRKDDFVVANIAAMNIEPYKRQLLLDKGNYDEVGKGQVVTDARGIVGSVVQTTDDFSRILLITDVNHAVPVESLRSGFRSILIGASNDEYVVLQHVPSNADVKEGDIFVTSGIGGKYPFGYPVAEVTKVESNEYNPFITVKLKPMANLGTNRQVLVLKQKQGTSENA